MGMGPTIDRGLDVGRVRNAKTALAAIIALFIISNSLLIFITGTSVSNEPNAKISYEKHDTITIVDNAGFLGSNSSTGIKTGSGAIGDPYIIEGWNISTDNGTGITIYNASVYFIIRNCSVHGNYSDYGGIVLSMCRNGTLEYNNCTRNNVGINITASQDIRIYHNTCNSSKKDITGNVVNGTGILLLSSHDNEIIDNDCHFNNGTGIRSIESNDNWIAGNGCDGNLEYGIWISESHNNTLWGNHCWGNNWYGIFIAQKSDNNDVVANDCRLNYDGMVIEDSDINAIHNNTIILNDYGILVYTLADNNTLNDNNCSSNSNIGINLHESTTSVLNNNTCTGNIYGLYLWFSDNNIITHNNCSGNANDGIYAGKSNGNIVVGNDCLNNSNGIWFHECVDNRISFNNCSGNTNNGIYFDYYSENNKLSHNNCSDNKNDGIRLDFCCRYNTLNNNICQKSSLHGIYIGDFSDNNTLFNNNCSEMNLYGMFLEGSSNNMIFNNEISNSYSYGLAIFGSFGGSENNTIWNNTFYHNNGTGDGYDPTKIQACDHCANNSWNSISGYGNWWSDWQNRDFDFDGFQDAPYNLSGTAVSEDFHPLATPPPQIPEFSDILIPISGLMLLALAFGRIRRPSPPQPR